MEITIKNIGLLPKAKIILDGLTVMAGENDTGKSTVGKVIFSIIKAANMATANQHCQFMNTMVNLVFDSQISNQGEVIVQDNGIPIYSVNFSQHQCVRFDCHQPDSSHFFKESTFIQTPLVWDLVDFFDSVLRLKQNQEMTQNIAPFSIKYPYIFWDVYVKITNTPVNKDSQTDDLVNHIRQIIQGSFEQHDKRIVFQRQNESILLMNVAAGIKYFGLLQRLAENNQLKPDHLLIIDEPENHLHPEWQLLLAELIVNLVNQHKVYVLINSHSPYLIEALKVYSDISIKERTHFYFNELTHKGVEVKEVTEDLSVLFDALSLPFQKLEQSSTCH
ncbi:ABC transporter ATP-binding protein [Beggiatoa sp. PS]|nr:ABC transporter ATP-binding protein [Beggiatoa sp. PS]